MIQWKKIVAVMALSVFVFLFLNYQYVWKQTKYFFYPPVSSTSFQVVTQNASTTNIDITSSTSIVLDEPNNITIASLGIRAPILYVEEKSEKRFQEALLFLVPYSAMFVQERQSPVRYKTK
jgi:hypothetical protein